MSRSSVVLGALLGLGILVQIAIGESGLAATSLRMVHAAIGYSGLAVVLVYLLVNRKSRGVLIVASIIFVLTVMQVTLGSLLFFEVSERDYEHRILAYVLLAVGLVGGIMAARLRRRQG